MEVFRCRVVLTECGDYSLWSCFIGILPESEIIWEPARQYAVTHILVSRLTEIISDGRTHYILERQRERGNVFGKKSHTNGVLWLRSPWWRVLLEITQLPVKGNRNNDRRRKQTCSDFLTDTIKKRINTGFDTTANPPLHRYRLLIILCSYWQELIISNIWAGLHTSTPFCTLFSICFSIFPFCYKQLRDVITFRYISVIELF